MSRNGFYLWSNEDSDKLMELCKARTWGDGEAWMAIAAQFPGRTVSACRHRYDEVKRNRAGKPTNRERPKYNYKNVVRTPEELADRLRPPPDLPPPASLTAFLCGDPLPGRSALDKKMQGVSA
jgi:Myb-like DNA-binding domain